MIASSIFLCSSILALSLCQSSTRNQMWRGTENSVLPLGQEFLHLQVLKRWFWVHDTRRQDISAGLCRHTSSHVFSTYWRLSSTCHILNNRRIYCSGRDLLCRRNASRISSSKECFRNGGAIGEPMWRRCQVWFLLLPVLHRGSGWGRDCTLEY